METFVLIDAGGGTTDLGLYRIANENPLRLKNEVNAPSGKFNQALRDVY